MKNLSIILHLSLFLILASFSPAGKKSLAIKKIVIDAGHGGKDPGTTGSFTKEKDLALKVSMLVGNYIQENIEGVEVIYTRKDDSSVDLKKRPEIANRNNSNLFVSIHANSLPKSTPLEKKKSTKGVEVYVMGVQNTDRALDVAKRENSVIFLEEDYEKNYQFDPKSEESNILYNLTQSAYQENSLLLASLIDNQLKKKSTKKELWSEAI